MQSLNREARNIPPAPERTCPAPSAFPHSEFFRGSLALPRDSSWALPPRNGDSVAAEEIEKRFEPLRKRRVRKNRGLRPRRRMHGAERGFQRHRVVGVDA